MKLSNKYNWASIAASIIVLLVSGLCYYFIIRYVLVNQLDQALKEEEDEVVDYVKANHSLPPDSHESGQEILFELLNGKTIARSFTSKDIFNKEENEETAVRQLVFPISVNDKTYQVSISKSQEETEYLIEVILFITLGVIILLLLVLFLINRFLLNKIWRPFNSTLEELKEFNLTTKKKLHLEDTSINEFAELNLAVKTMADRVNIDYESLKAFTENASHEMQTPLAIINSKLDILIQDESLNAHQMRQLQGIYDTLSKLSRLMQSLLLLTKIENEQFAETEDFDLSALLKSKLIQFEELLQGKKISTEEDIEHNIIIKGNKYLVDILISNLLTNAIRYTKQRGVILISLSKGRFAISNTSELPALEEHNLFQRFYRHSDTKEYGNGLGLSIVKQICDVAGYTLAYHYHNNFHEFSIDF